MRIGFVLDWNTENQSAIVLAQNMFRELAFLMNEKKMDEKDRFIQTFAHELAHCYYGDHPQVTPTPPEIDTNHWNSIYELRADLKVEKWGALRIKDDTYLHGKDKGLNWESDWESDWVHTVR